MVTPEIREVRSYRLLEDTGRRGVPIDTRMGTGEIIRLRCAPLEEPEFNSPFDRDE
jgi:hypothetical protein